MRMDWKRISILRAERPVVNKQGSFFLPHYSYNSRPRCPFSPGAFSLPGGFPLLLVWSAYPLRSVLSARRLPAAFRLACVSSPECSLCPVTSRCFRSGLRILPGAFFLPGGSPLLSVWPAYPSGGHRVWEGPLKDAGT